MYTIILSLLLNFGAVSDINLNNVTDPTSFEIGDPTGIGSNREIGDPTGIGNGREIGDPTGIGKN